jgi:hypothetical protein
MFNFSANHLFLLSRTEYPSCAVFLLRDLDTQRVYRLHDFTKAQLIRPDVAYCVAADSGDVSTRTGPVSPRACVPGVNAIVCPDVEIGIPADVKTGQTAVLLFRA